MAGPIRRKYYFIFSITLSLAAISACGGKKAAPPEVATQAVVTCPPPPTPCPAPPSQQDLLDRLREVLEESKAKTFSAQAAQFGVMEKIGQKEISSEDFAKFVSFIWAVDPALRVDYLRAMEKTNQLVDFLKPTDGGKFDLMAVPEEPEKDVAFRISEVIVDWALVQKRLVDTIRDLGVENVKPVLPGDDLPQAEAMMREIIPLLTPPEAPPAPGALFKDPFDLLIGEANAQTKRAAKTKPPVMKYPAKAIALFKTLPRIKVKQAPLLLARTLSFKVGPAMVVLESPFMKAIPEFRAVPVEQFTFKLEKHFVGDAYFNEVLTQATELGNTPQRDQPAWWQMAASLTELNLLLNLVRPNFGEAPPTPSPAPVPPPATQPSPGTPGLPGPAGATAAPPPGPATPPEGSLAPLPSPPNPPSPPEKPPSGIPAPVPGSNPQPEQ